MFFRRNTRRVLRKTSLQWQCRPQLERLEDRRLLSGMDPTVLISGAANAPEGQSYLLNLTAVDPENDPVTGWTINWGDGATQNIVGNPSTIRHTYAAGPNAYNVTASAVVGGTQFAAKLADAGRYLGVFVAPGTGGLDFPRWMSFGPDGNLYVSQLGTNSIGRYDGNTGAFLNTFVAGIQGPLAFGADGSLYVGDYATNSVQHYNNSGAFLGTFISPGSGGLNEPSGLVFGPDGNLYVGNYYGDVRRYDGTTGTFMNLFVADVPSTSDASTALLFGPDGRLYVNSGNAPKVTQHDGNTGAYLGDFIPTRYGDTNSPYGMAFGPDGDFYLGSSNAGTSNSSFNKVLRFDGATGELIDVYASGSEQDGLFTTVFGPDGNLYVSSMYNDSILRYTSPLTAGTASQLTVTVLDVSTYNNTTPQNITSLKTIRSTVSVADSFSVRDVNVKVDIDHTYDADLDVYLISPSGTRLALFTDVGGSGDNFRNTTIDDEARLLTYSGVAPFTGSYQPSGRGAGSRLSVFDGQSATGVWTLEITDDYKGNSGKLKSWSLSLARAASALNAASAGANAEAAHGALMTDSQVQPLLTEAIARWQAAGADVSSLASVDIRIANLGGTTLGVASGNTITVDDNAAGWGWFVDKTPKGDLEFVRPGNQGEQNRMDLLTVVMHELGHLLDYDHDQEGVMAKALAVGVRRTDAEHDHAALVDQVFDQPVDHHADGWLGAVLDEQLDSRRLWFKRRR